MDCGSEKAQAANFKLQASLSFNCLRFEDCKREANDQT